ncbi:IS5 family transposase [Candidatus Fukatsuia symbiotica]|uniref:IS5 family transposase n=1 Tax=Candidatus Fukatsuia TaxID=1927833 RepID=UPI001F085D89|nr:IS5 family transposase [Candidatus Fukatsuia symbiotica]MEA9445523.1 IS5 family transposase [Candidatus Fukatsuia symbiotica]
MKYEQIKVLEEEKFRRLTGVKRSTFEKMIKILNEADKCKQGKGGRKPKLGLEDRLLMALEYLREYRTYFHVSRSDGVSESTCYETIKWIENTLIKHPDFALSGRKALLKSDREYELVLIDATETPIERPPKKQKQFYSGKKKRPTLKTQVIVDKKSKAVICTSFTHGRRHDFRLFKESGVRIHPEIKTVTDTGYQGLGKIHSNSALPKKKTKKNPLTKEDKRNNRELSSQRVLNENVIVMIKRFKIVSDRYRNRRKRFGLRFNLIAAIYNMEIR